jgi:hypothetical protein
VVVVEMALALLAATVVGLVQLHHLLSLPCSFLISYLLLLVLVVLLVEQVWEQQFYLG